MVIFLGSILTTIDSHRIQNLELGEIEKFVQQINAEKDAEAERRRNRLAATAGAQASMS